MKSLSGPMKDQLRYVEALLEMGFIRNFRGKYVEPDDRAVTEAPYNGNMFATLVPWGPATK